MAADSLGVKKVPAALREPRLGATSVGPCSTHLLVSRALAHGSPIVTFLRERDPGEKVSGA